MAGGRIHPARQPKRGADRSALRAPTTLPERIAACVCTIAGDGIGEPERRAMVAVARLTVHPHPRGMCRDLAERRNWALGRDLGRLGFASSRLGGRVRLAHLTAA
jgi:hypothetical protein